MKRKTDPAHRLLELLDRELTAADLDLLSSFNRRRLAGLLDHWARLAERPGPPQAQHGSYE